MNNYHVFDYKDKETWPMDDEYILMWDNSCTYPFICKFSNNSIIGTCGENYSKFALNGNIYCYIGKQPKIVKSCLSNKCGLDLCHCEFYEDGYCMNQEFCKWAKSKKEYVIE